MFHQNTAIVSNLSGFSKNLIVKNVKLPVGLRFTPLRSDLPCT